MKRPSMSDSVDRISQKISYRVYFFQRVICKSTGGGSMMVDENTYYRPWVWHQTRFKHSHCFVVYRSCIYLISWCATRWQTCLTYYQYTVVTHRQETYWTYSSPINRQQTNDHDQLWLFVIQKCSWGRIADDTLTPLVDRLISLDRPPW